jgi:hypothetical protein
MCLTFPIGCVQQASSVNWTMCQIEELNLWHRHDTLFDAEPPKDITRMSLWIYIGLLSHVFCYLEFETINYEHMFWGRPWQTYFHIPISYPSQIQQTSNRSKKTSKQQTNIRDKLEHNFSHTAIFFSIQVTNTLRTKRLGLPYFLGLRTAWPPALELRSCGMKTGGSGGQGLGTDSIGCHIKKATKPEMWKYVYVYM